MEGASAEGGGRRRVGALLDAYYGLEGGGVALNRADSLPSMSSSNTAAAGGAELDKETFDAQRFFDKVVAGSSVVEVVRTANGIDAETKDLDGDMQMVCYENYSKFIRATELNNQVKTAMSGLDPDLRLLQGSFKNILDLQVSVDSAISDKAEQVEGLIKQQQQCKKLKVLFTLPTTLSKCLERGAYGQAAKAYSSCVGFLRMHKGIKTFQVVLDDVEHQMGRIQSALEKRLLSPDLKVEEALATATTLLLLGEDATKVSKDFLSGRSASLREALKWCFPSNVSAEADVVETAFFRATQRFIPEMSESVDGFQTAWRDHQLAGEDDVLEKFVSARVEDLFDQLSAAVGKQCPSPQALVLCVHKVRDSLRRLHSLKPRLLTKVFTAFISHVANSAIEALFTKAALAGLDHLLALRQLCTEQEHGATQGFVDLVAKTENELLSLSLSCLNDTLPLKALIGEDKASKKQLARTVHDQLTAFFGTIAEAACASTSSEVSAGFVLADSVASRCREFSTLDWHGGFALAYMRICQHLEDKGLGKAWTLADDQFGLRGATPDANAQKALSTAAEKLLAHYVLMFGQKFAHFFRNATETKKWTSAKEPKEPSLVIEMVFQQVHECDGDISRMLSDNKRPRAGAGRGKARFSEQEKDSMELEMERLWAKKMQAFGPVPFSRNATIAAILRIAFKALYEYAREQTFNMYGLQQMQVDCTLLSDLARDFVDGEDINTLEAVLGEVLSSVTQRCLEPVLMEAVMVNTLCDEKKRTLRLE